MSREPDEELDPGEKTLQTALVLNGHRDAVRKGGEGLTKHFSKTEDYRSSSPGLPATREGKGEGGREGNS